LKGLSQGGRKNVNFKGGAPLGNRKKGERTSTEKPRVGDVPITERIVNKRRKGYRHGPQDKG